ncbi:MAG TPA: glycoside hydrolase family 3 N-terminal domain-containing protein, partial [Calditrichia bacterium]|nr:glycoside hydrolase family 3 N-terminal domain-containing protein [Calditrichia bacterium]
PRWGRIAEGFGEDPFLASQMAAAMVKGFQGDDLADPHTIAACAKHFVGYGAAEGGRDYDRAIIPDHMLRNVFLPPFRAAVDAGVATVMTSFNEINGIPASGHVKILREILKKEWGFEGFVVSDWESTKEMIAHGYCEDMRDVARKSARAGVDMEMQSSAYGDHLEALVRGGEIPEALIDDAARRILKIKFDLGLFENPSPYRIAPPRPPLAADLALARESALKSLVLLENSGILPLSPSLKSLAVIGPMADDPYEMLGTWNRDGLPEESITPLAGIRNLVGESVSIHYAPGLDFSRDKNRSGFEAAVAAAQSAEVVLFFAGEESILSGEAHSRAYLDLPGAQNELLEALAATGKPVVLIIMAGRPLVVGNLLDKTAALLYAWHPGTMGGPAIADVLFGKEAPSGKLTITFPKAEGQIPVYYAHKNTGRPPHSRKLTMMDDIPRRAYQSSLGDASRYLDIGYLPQYPFGYGLNYTRFEYGDLKLTSAVLKPGETLTVSATIRNSGKRDGAEIVQLYIRDLVGSLTRPVRELKGFQKINLKAGESRQVSFELRPAQLGFYNGDEQYVVEPGRFQVWIAPDAQSGLMGEFELLPGS